MTVRLPGSSSVLLAGLDVLAATVVATVATIALSFRGLESLVTWDFLGILAVVGMAATAFSVPYQRFVVRSASGVVRRAAVAGIAYAIAIVVAFAGVDAVVTGLTWDYRRGGATPDLIFEVLVLLTLPFTVLGGLLFGSIHGLLARRLTRASANAPIVTG